MATAKKRRPAKSKGKKSVTRTLHYKRAEFLPDDTAGATLANFLDLALSKKTRPSLRMERLAGSSDSVRVINKCYLENGMICGRFLDYTEGGAQAVLELDDDADELRIKTLPPTKREQYLEGILTFGIQDNQVVLIQSKALQRGHFENHLNWLLTTQTHALPNGVRVFLHDEPPGELNGKMSGVNSILLKEVLPAAIFTNATEDTPIHGLAPVVQTLRRLLPKGQDFLGRKLNPQQALALEGLEISLQISRKRKKHGMSIIDDVAHVLRNLDEIDFELRARGGTLRSDSLRLSVQRTIDIDASGMLSLPHVAEVMQRWLGDLLAEGRVQG